MSFKRILCVIAAVVPLRHFAFGRCYFFRCNFENLVFIHIPDNAKNHIARVVKHPVAFIENIRRNFRYAFHRTGNIVSYGIFPIQASQKAVIHFRRRRIVDHTYFLSDYSLLFPNTLLGKIRRGDKIQQYLKVFLKFLHTFKMIRRQIKRGVRIG